MKKFFTLCMISILVFVSFSVSYASIPRTMEKNVGEMYFNEILQKSADIINIIREDPEGFGIKADTDLDKLYLGNEILSFEKTEDGINAMENMSYYPLCTSSGDIVGLMIAFLDEDGQIHVDYTPELVCELELKEVNDIAGPLFIYDSNGLYTLSNDGFCELYKNESSNATREALKDSDYSYLAQIMNASETEKSDLCKIPNSNRNAYSSLSSGSVMLSVPTIKQDTGSSYCWACSFVSLGRYFFTSSAYNYDARQLAINITGNMSTAQTVSQTRTHLYNYFPMVANGYTYTIYSTGLTYLTLRTKIDSGYPILGRVDNGPGHMVVVCGYANSSGEYYTMMDPITGTYRIGNVVAERPVYSSPSSGGVYSFTHRITH